MDNTEYIENFFKGNIDSNQKDQFERKIMEDESFAEEVAFYISANNVLQERLHEEKKERFRELYEQGKVISMAPRLKSVWKYMAAASILIAIILVTWFVSVNRNTPQQLADKYIQQNFTTLEVTMSATQDSLQKGLSLFNNNNLSEALTMFETLAHNDPENDEAKKYAGIICLRLKNYDKALEYFSMLEKEDLRSNPGKFYKAVTLLERNKAGDKDAAKVLLEEVKNENLEGKNEAQEWLKKLE